MVSLLGGAGMQSSPRTWGCFSEGERRELGKDVFPTHVGVFLK